MRSPLLLMTDQEGGWSGACPDGRCCRRSRSASPPTRPPRPQAAGTGAGQNLAGVGMNVNLAPVLDVFRKAGNFIDQFGRSYSTTRTWSPARRRLHHAPSRSAGVAATAKHFPGLGAATGPRTPTCGR